jgi:phage-related protein (TIGR01555 family)
MSLKRRITSVRSPQVTSVRVGRRPEITELAGATSERSRKPPLEAEAAVAPARKPTKISEALQAFARHKPSESPIPLEDVFRPYSPPPMVVPENWKPPELAQDEVPFIASTWAAGALYSMYAEGLFFLGYPVLAEMAQRPEYRRFASVISTECTRKWIELQSTGEEDDKAQKQRSKKIRKINAELDRLRARDRCRDWVESDLLMGRSHLFLDDGSWDKPDELKTGIGDGTDKASKVKVGNKKHFLRALRNVEAVWTYPNDYDTSNPLSPSWYKPRQWWVMGNLVHSTRLLTMVGHPVPDLLKPAYAFGGISMSQLTKPYVDNWLDTRQAVTDIIKSYTTWILATDLDTTLQGGANDIQARVEFFINCMRNLGIFLVNKEQEEFNNVAAPLSGLDSLKALAHEDLCSASGLPVIKYMGIQPAGLNASSEGEIRTFEDWTNAYQERTLREPLTRIIGFIQLSLFGEVDEDITFRFVPLHTMTELEEAQIQKAKADTDAELIEAGVLNAEESRRRIANDPDSDYQSLDVSDVPEATPDEQAEMAKIAAGGAAGGKEAPEASGKGAEGPKPKKLGKIGGAGLPAPAAKAKAPTAKKAA